LAAKLTGYKIDIRGKSGTPKEVEAKGKAAQEEAKKAFGVGQEEPETKVEEVADAQLDQSGVTEAANGEPRSEKREKTSAKGDTDKSVDDAPVADKEPLVADAEEKQEEQEAEKIVDELKVAQSPGKPDQASEKEGAPKDLGSVEPKETKVLQEKQEENESKPDSSGDDK
jgi:hypothetical protein